jgi:hypothetical protein
MTEDRYVVEFTDDPAAFLAAAAHYLAADPVLTTVVATVTQRAVAEDERGESRAGGRPRWWVLVREHGEVVGVGMRTAPFVPYPLFVLPLPEDAARQLARILHARGEVVSGVNGALPAALTIAEETAGLSGGTASVHEHTRLHELGELIEPAQSPGRLRAAGEADLALAVRWFNAFARDAAEQAGREEEDPATWERIDEVEMSRRIADRRVWLWEDERGEVVHLTGYNAPAFGVVRVGPVYTPAGQRGRGYASAAVAGISRNLLDEGLRVCLFTDQANPTSNKIYAALGYRPVVDMVNLVVG